MSGTCANILTIAREALEVRVLASLGEKLMTPKVAAEARRKPMRFARAAGIDEN